MNMWKILLISILQFGSKVQAGWMTNNIEPFLFSSQGVYIENGGFWKEFTNSNKALYAYPDPDPISSRFYPKRFKHGNGKLVYFECGGGYPNTVIEVYGKGYLYCGPFNGTPTRNQLFDAIDSENGTIAIVSIVTHGHVVMWHNYPWASPVTGICDSDDCRFKLVYPPNKLPIYELFNLTLNPKNMNIYDCRDDNIDDGHNPAYNIGNLVHTKMNYTHQFVAKRTMIHTTNWSYNFALNYHFERTLNISKIWSGLSNSVIIGFDGTKGIAFCKTFGTNFESSGLCKKVNHTFKKTVTLEAPPMTYLHAIFRVKACKVQIPFTAKIHRTEFDTLTGMPMYSNLTEHGFWKGSLLGNNPHIYCWMVPGQNPFNTLTNEVQEYKKCRIFEEEDEMLVQL